MASAAHSPSGLEKISTLLQAPEPAVRLLLSLLLGFPLALIHRYLLYGKNASLQHIFFLSSGLLLGFCNYDWGILHSAATLFGTYLIFKFLGSTKISVIIIFTFNMAYLLCGYFVTSTDSYDIKWTMPQCVLTLRMIGLAFDLYDGQKPKDKLSVTQQKNLLPNQPSLLAVFSYGFFPGSFLVGPQFGMRRYLDYVGDKLLEKTEENQENPSKLPECLFIGAKRAFMGVVYIALHQIGNLYIPDEFILGDGFREASFFKQCFFICFWSHVGLYKYISVWLIAEGVCIAFGLSYNGKDTSGQTKWDACANIKLPVFENASCLNHYILSFNINTNQWCAEYIYKRLRFLGSKLLSQLFTLFFLAIWHGFHSGYYMTFFMEFIAMYFEKDIGPVLLANEKLQQLRNKNIFTRLASSLLLKTYAIFFMGYSLIAFNFLSFSKYMTVYSNMYFVGHVLFLSYPLLASFVKSALRPTKQHLHTE